jgi:hypothetical protein
MISMMAAQPEEDMFDDLLNLEEKYYQDGYTLGMKDGSQAGRIEGRTFGLEKGFEKFFEMGKLGGKAFVLEARLPSSASINLNTEARAKNVKMLPNNERLAKHIRMMSGLTELESLSTKNGEDEVSEFDDRLKRADAKAKVIENIVGDARGSEKTLGGGGGSSTSSSKMAGLGQVSKLMD